MSKELVLAVEGGGTKTLALLADTDGREVARLAAGPGNARTLGAQGVARLLAELLAGFERALGTPALPRIGAVSLAMAGCDSDDEKKMLRAVVREAGLHGRLVLNGDARATLYGACGATGVLVIAGTGSIAYGRNALGEERRAGGWGRAFGDEGSAYALGCHALTETTKTLDGRAAPGQLTRRVLASLGAESGPQARHALVALIDQVGPIARLAPLVVAAAREGDPAASRILEAGVGGLLEMVLAVASGLRMSGEELRVAAYGGLLAHNPHYTQRLQESIRLAWPRAQVSLAPDDAGLRGALLLALEKEAHDV